MIESLEAHMTIQIVDVVFSRERITNMSSIKGESTIIKIAVVSEAWDEG